ncbi:hypothetical protein B0H11DRAFT_2229498 [Mycena galericulata]|nr:hypothetical protein B0H11DRAFT_2229498 [Mycena galericulata]
MSGPSIQTTRFVRGWNDTEEEDPMYVWADELPAGETDELLGHVMDGSVERWVWPTEDLLQELCEHYTGEITPALHRCLMVIYEEVNKRQVKARSRSQWYQFFRIGNRPGSSGNRVEGKAATASTDSTQETAYKLSDVDFDEEESRMKRVFSDDWSKVKVRDIVLPGMFRPF